MSDETWLWKEMHKLCEPEFLKELEKEGDKMVYLCTCGHGLSHHNYTNHACAIDGCNCAYYTQSNGEKLEEEELRKTLESLRFSEISSLLRLLAICYSPNTKYFPLPEGTKNWSVRVPLCNPALSEEPELGLFVHEGKDITLPLIEFFGMHIAYCVEIDTLAYWVRRK